MAHFYGTVEGNRAKVSRLGTKHSGLETVTASWSGAVHVLLWYDKKTETDMTEIELFPWHGSGVNRTLYRGPVSGRKGLIPVEEPA